MNIKSDKIRILIAEKNYNNKEFARKIGISSTWLNTTLKKNEATANIVVKMARGLGVNPEEILSEEN